MNNRRPAGGGLNVVLTRWILSWLKRNRAGESADGTIRYGWRLRAVAVVLIGIALAIGFLVLSTADGQRAFPYVMGSAVLLGAVWMFLEVFFLRGSICEEHLVVSSWRGRREIPWRAIDGYAYSEANHWYVLSTRGFGKVRLSEYLDGVERVVERL